MGVVQLSRLLVGRIKAAGQVKALGRHVSIIGDSPQVNKRAARRANRARPIWLSKQVYHLAVGLPARQLDDCRPAGCG